MNKRILKYLPWLVVASFIIYNFIHEDKNLNEALKDLNIAKSELDSAKNNLDSSLLTINQFKDSIKIYISKTSKYNIDLKILLDSIRDEVNKNKKGIERINSSLKKRALNENNSSKKTEVIQN